MQRLMPIVIALIYAGLSLFVARSIALRSDALIGSDVYAFFAIVLPCLLIPVFLIYRHIKHRKWHWAIVGVGCAIVIVASYQHIISMAVAAFRITW